MSGKSSLHKIVLPVVFVLSVVVISGIGGQLLASCNQSPPEPTISDAHVSLRERVGSQALLYYCKTNFTKAEPIFLQKLDQSKVDDLNFLGGFYRDWGRWDKARDCYNKALALAKQQNDERFQSLILNNSAMVDFLEAQTFLDREFINRKFDHAGSLWSEALTLAKKSGAKDLESLINDNCTSLQKERN